MKVKFDLLQLLPHIPPSSLSYEEWLHVGMGLQYEGYSVNDWDSWSQNDSRYIEGECHRKWSTFIGSGHMITGATITQLAKDNGWQPRSSTDKELDWDSEINDDYVVIDKDWVEDEEIKEPENWNPIIDLTKYLEVLFEASEYVGYVVEAWQKEGSEKFLPTEGKYKRTAGELIQELNKSNDLGAVLGDYNDIAGAWIRYNPLDSKGIRTTNVTNFRHALVESDEISIEKQNAIIRELELPISCLVHSGKKSLHAIVKVEAMDEKEYRKRVEYLYDVCKKNGLKVDTQNRNPSRLSRMPGVIRNGQKQFLVDTNIGKESWNEWYEYIESINDDLPEPEGLADHWNNLPPLAPVLIEGVLRQGHKMLMAGPSKAGKSFALIELSIAIAEGDKWLGWRCAQGKILYVNLELDRASCLHRFKDVYTALGLSPKNLSNVDIWNLRGKTAPLDKLAPKLIRRAAKKNYIAVIIDPIYKVLTGDENSADQMAQFTNQFDKICTELGVAVIYCHHHSKGAQGGKKSMDRASGSGVFARDPDALIDLVELELTDEILKQQENKLVAKVCEDGLKELNPTYLKENVSQDDLCSAAQMESHLVEAEVHKEMVEKRNKARESVQNLTAWRIEGTLREFPKFKPVNMWFNYPTHEVDRSGVLRDIKVEDEAPKKLGRKSPEQKKKERKESLEVAFENCLDSEKVTLKDLADYIGITIGTVKNHIKEFGIFEIIPQKDENGASLPSVVVRTSQG